MRLSKEEYYLEIAKAVAKRSTCLRRKYGAVIVKNDAIVSTGYNGPARGVINCEEVGCLKDLMNAPHYSGYEFCTAVHAEENAIINAARYGASVMDATLFIYGEDAKNGNLCEAKPCDRCKRAIINSGIKKVIIKKANGSIERIDVKRWVKEDSEKYIKRLREARKT